jgi:hypothetical protein
VLRLPQSKFLESGRNHVQRETAEGAHLDLSEAATRYRRWGTYAAVSGAIFLKWKDQQRHRDHYVISHAYQLPYVLVSPIAGHLVIA